MSFDLVDNPDLRSGLTEVNDRKPGYINARLYAEGRSPELFLLSQAARQAITKMIDEYRLNFAALPISVVSDRLAIMDFLSNDEKHLEEIMSRNQFWQWSRDLIVDVLTDGDAYVILSDDGEGNTLMNPVDAASTRVVYDDETERTPLYAIRQWKIRGSDSDGRRATFRANLWYDDRVERYINPNMGGWRLFDGDGVPSIYDHGYPELPVVHFRTKAPYGVPIHYAAYGPQDMIVKLVMTFVAGVEYTGWPQRFLLQDLAQLGQSTLPGRPLPGGAVEPANKLIASPGSLWELYGKSVGSFPAADLTKLSDSIAFSVRAMAQVTRIPFHYFDPSGDAPSGESLRMADAPVTAMTGAVRRSLTWSFDRLQRLALAYEGRKSEVNTIWAPDAPITDRDWWETANIKVQLGVPAERIMIEAGYTDDQIKEFALDIDQPPVIEETTDDDD